MGRGLLPRYYSFLGTPLHISNIQPSTAPSLSTSLRHILLVLRFSFPSVNLFRKRTVEMGRLFVVNLEGKFYSCKHCRTHLALCDDVVSKSFHCRHGKAYLFNEVVNITVGEKEDRVMTTGMHTVADIFCVSCGSIVGWKYETAHEKDQKYKEGKSVLERFKILGPDGSSYWGSSHGGTDADDV